MDFNTLVIISGIIIGVAAVLLIIVVRAILRTRKRTISPREQALRLQEDLDRQYARQKYWRLSGKRLLTFLLTGILGALLIGLGVWDWSSADFGDEWPLAIATVQSMSSRQVLGEASQGVTYELRAEYTFEFNTRVQRGVISQSGATQAQSDAFVERYAQGNPIAFYVHPNFPQIHTQTLVNPAYNAVPIGIGAVLALIAVVSLISGLAALVRAMRI